jgi:MFS family permease
MGLAFYYSSNEEAQWRAPLGIGLIWPILMLLIVPLVPESPRYLLLKGRSDEAWEVISKLHGGKTASEQSYARAEFYQMKRQADLDRTLNASWKQLFVKRSYRKRMIMATGISFLGQSSAVLVINNYVRHLFP